MIELITNIEQKLIHRLADLCNDQYFKDFNPQTYEEALYRADRKVASKYQILNRIIKFNSKIIVPPESADDTDYVTEQKNTDIELNISTFHQEYKVLINELPYVRGKRNALVDNAVDQTSYTYYLYYGHNTWLFNYNPRGVDDNVVIFYMSGATLETFDADTNRPVIPDKFEDERIKYALRHIASMGIAKFKEDKKQKYIDIFRLNNKEATDPSLLESKAFIKIQPFKYP